MNDLTTIARLYLESIACCDFQKVKQLLHEKYTFTNTEGQVFNGPDMRFDTAGLILNAFPDLSFEIIHGFQSGNVVITEFLMRGSHQGEMKSISVSNSRIAVPACSIIEIEDGLIVSEREYYDKICLLQHLRATESSEQNVRLLA